MALLDVSNAFGAVPHAAIHAALSAAGVGERFRDLVAQVYTGNTTQYICAAGVTEDIPMLSGIRQGCPLSGLLFNLAVDPTLRALGAPEGDAPPPALAYADDIALLASTPEALQANIANAHRVLRTIGLRLKPSKCRTLCVLRGSVAEREFSLETDGEVTPLPCMVEGEAARYLGKPVGFNLVQSWGGLKDQERLLDSIAASSLRDHQKLDALAQFVQPATVFPLRMGRYSRRMLEVYDRAVRARARGFLSLGHGSSNHFLYTGREDGGVGLLEATTEADIWAVDTAYKLLTSPDAWVRETAKTDLEAEAKRAHAREVGGGDMYSYMNSPSANYRALDGSCFSRARIASCRLGVRWLPPCNEEDMGLPRIELPERVSLGARRSTAPTGAVETPEPTEEGEGEGGDATEPEIDGPEEEDWLAAPPNPWDLSPADDLPPSEQTPPVAALQGGTPCPPHPDGPDAPERSAPSPAGATAPEQSRPGRDDDSAPGPPPPIPAGGTAQEAGTGLHPSPPLLEVAQEPDPLDAEQGPADNTAEIVSINARHLLVRKLRGLVSKAHADEWRAQRTQGIFAHALEGVGRESTYFLRSGENMRPPVYNFVHAARLNSSPGLRHQPQHDRGDRTCRRKCRQMRDQSAPAAETIGHVITECNSHSAARLLRHNRVLAHLRNAAVANGWSVLFENQTVAGQSRPDLVIGKGHQAVCVDAAVCAAYQGSLERRYAEKAAKYREICPSLINRGFREIEFLPLVVGALGEWCKESGAALRKLLPQSRIKQVRERVVAEAVNGSAAIYYDHVALHNLIPAEYRSSCSRNT